MKKTETGLLFFVICSIISYCIFLQFISPAFYESDSYYHVFVTRLIKDYGFHYQFPWAQFSTLKDFYADKDFLFHFISVPFLYLNSDIVTAGKYAVIFYDIVFILVYVFILRKYLSNYLAGYFLLLPFLSVTFTTYILDLRSFTLANILTILGIYFLIEKKPVRVFIICLLYALSHTSFITIVAFALICEAIRYIFHKEVFFKNIYIPVMGILFGCLIHPNFPNNFLYTHLCFLVEGYIKKGINLGFGEELFSFSTARVFIENFALFFSLNVIFWMAVYSRVKINFATAVWAACANFYIIFAFQSDRHWYPANILFFIFFAAYLKDWLAHKEKKAVSLKINIFIILYLLIAAAFLPAGLKNLKATIEYHTRVGAHYKKVGLWMKGHIPPAETVYHNNWNESAYFICFNPANNYIVVLDPMYMFYRYPGRYLFYRDLSLGKNAEPYKALKNVFKVKYGYTRKNNSFYLRLHNAPDEFKILYEDDLGVVFKLEP